MSCVSCGFQPGAECGQLDEQHIYCHNCRAVVHLGIRDPIKFAGKCSMCDGWMLWYRKSDDSTYFRTDGYRRVVPESVINL